MIALLIILLVLNAIFLGINGLRFLNGDSTAGAIALLNFAAVVSCAMSIAGNM